MPGTVGVYLPTWIVRGRNIADGPSFFAGCLLLLLGASIYAWCVWDFATFGRGSPAPIDAPKRLVVRGLYRYSRNPMYVGVLTVILGWSAIFRSTAVTLYALVIGVFFQTFVMVYEEPHLRAAFGGEYEAYRARVGRWIPRMRRG